MENKRTVNDFVEDMNYMLQGAEPQDENVVQFLYQNYIEMFQNECGVVPNFCINNKGQIELLPPEV